MGFEQPAGAFGAAGLFVGDGDQHQVAIDGDTLAMQREQGRQLSDPQPLDIDGAPSPDLAVEQAAGEGRRAPAAAGGYDVDMMHQRQGAAAAARGR